MLHKTAVNNVVVMSFYNIEQNSHITEMFLLLTLSFLEAHLETWQTFMTDKFLENR